MHRKMLMLAVAAGVLTTAACTKKDINAITGSTDYTSVQLSSDPTSFSVHVVRNPADTIASSDPAYVPLPYYVAADSTAFTPTATIEPQGVAISNGTDNMTFTFAPAIASVNSSSYVQGDTLGTSTMTITYTDVNHDFTTTSITVPVTVTLFSPPPRRVH
jgi:hypothetical protein